MMYFVGRSGTIQFWLGWLVVVCLFPAWMATALVVGLSYQAQRSAIARETSESPRALMQAVDWELERARDSLLALALSAPRSSGDVAEFDKLARRFVSQLHVDNVVLIDPAGQQIVNTLVPFGAPLPVQSADGPSRKVLEVFKSGEPVTSDLFLGAVTKAPILALAVPVYRDGKVVYSLAIGIKPERIDAALRRQRLPSDWVTAIVDSTGTIVARSIAAERYVGHKGTPAFLRDLAETGTGTDEATTTLEGLPVLLAFSRSATTGWGVGIGIPTKSLAAVVWRTFWVTVAGVICLLVLALFIARTLSTRIAHSIRALVPPAVALGLGEPITITRGKIAEVNEVGSALVRTARLLDERRIARETAEIAAQHMRDAKAEADKATEVELRERLAMEAANASLNMLSRHLSKARDQAEQANRAKSRFLAAMSHELRTPLNGILGYAQLLQMEGGLNPTQSGRVDAMQGAGRHLLEMITCILDISEIEADHVTLRPASVDTRAIASASLDLVRPAAEVKGLALRLVIASGTPGELINDPMRVRQVLLNLLGNAVKFTSEGAVELRLQVTPDGSALRIEVADTGTGIPAGQRPRLFQDFGRLDAEITSKAEGAGLGLALSARLTALMGGRIGHEDNPGGGSIFYLELPLQSDVRSASSASSAPALPDAQSTVSSFRALHVLIVDDIAMNRDIASAFVRAAGRTAVCVEGGAQGVAAVADAHFDIVLMDVRMPVVDGLEATRRIRALDGQRGLVPILALTAQAFSDQVAACHNAGMDSHVGKPFDQATLIAGIERAMCAARLSVADTGADPAPAAMPADAVADTVHELRPPVFVQERFERTASLLAPEVIATYLQTITRLGEALLSDLRGLSGFTKGDDEVADAAHRLAGSAGMFGFERLASDGCYFEVMLRAGTGDVPAIRDGLYATIDASLEEVKKVHARFA